jgi:3-dehydroquinate synthetase
MGLWKEGDFERLIRLLKDAGLPTAIPRYMKVPDVIDAMKLDKKARGGKIEMALPASIGRMADAGGSYGLKIEESIILDTAR